MNGNKKTLKTIGLVVFTALLTLFFVGCPNIFGGDDGGGGGGSPDPASKAVTDNLENDLNAAGLTEAQVQAIKEGAVGSLSEEGLTDSTDTEAVLTTMVDGSQRALSGDNFTDEERLAAIEAIVGSAVGSISDGAGSRSLRASQTSDILGAIVTASVSAIGDSGFDEDSSSRRQAAGSSTGGAMSNLGRAGISSDGAVAAARRIAESGVTALGDGGYDDSDVGDSAGSGGAARFLTRQILANVDDTGIVGLDLEFEIRNFGREVSRGVTSNLGKNEFVTGANAGSALTGISRGATGALEDIIVNADIKTIVDDLTGEVSRGVTESLKDLKSDVTDLNIQASVRTVVRGTTEGLSDLGRNSTRFGATVITADAFDAGIRGASAGARLSDETIDENALKGELEEEIDDLSSDNPALRTQLAALKSKLATLIDDGFKQALNEAPTASISVTADGSALSSGDSVNAGTTVTMTGTATDSADDDEGDGGSLDVRITLRGPNGSELDSRRSDELIETNNLSVSIDNSLNVPGSYRITVNVTDGIDSDSTTFTLTAESTISEDDQDALMARGVSFLEEGYVNDALNDFQTLYQADSNYVPGALAYSLIDMATVLTDEEMVSFARDTLGLTDYPTRVADVLNPELWMRSVYDPSSDSFVLFPRVARQSDRDGDGVVDPGERLIQITENMIAASATNDTFVDLFAGKLGDKLDALQAQVGGISASDGFTITHTMVFQTPAEATDTGWPKDETGDFEGFTIGTAELNVILATGRLMQFLNQWGQAISVEVNYDYYLFDEDDEFRLIFDPPESETELTPSDIYTFPALGPLARNSFLDSRADAETHLAAAGDAFVTMLDTIAEAMADISDRGVDSDFSVKTDTIEQLLSADPETALTDPAAFLDDVATVFQTLADEVDTSYSEGGGTPAYLPVPGEALDGAQPEEYFATYADSWPTSTAGVNSDGVLAFDFGVLFGTSIGGISGVFELDSDTREPVLYKYSNPGSVERLSEKDGATVAQLETAAKTASFTKTTSLSAATNDASSIYFVRIPDATLGMVADSVTQADLDQLNVDSNIGEDWDDDLGGEYEVFEGHEVLARFDGNKVEMFIRVPTTLAGHLFEDKGTEFSVYDWALDDDAELVTTTSLGSFWWGVIALD